MLGRGSFSMFSQKGSGTSDPSAGYASYTGLVATRGLINNQYAAGNPTASCRTLHFAADNITTIGLIFGGWYATPTETNLGVSNTWRASIEYPAGTFNQILFSGVASGTCASGGLLVSDLRSLAIPKGSAFWVRSWQSNANGLMYMAGANGLDAMTFGAAAPDQTMGGTVGGGGNVISPPMAIIGATTRASVAILGDSRGRGAGDTVPDAVTGNAGAINRSLTNIGWINFSISGVDGTSLLAAAAPKRIALAAAANCTHLLNNMGINDLTGGATSATLLTRNQQIKTDWGNRPTVICTLEPHSTSTDAWATVVNQTTTSENAQRVTYNTALRANPAWALGVIEAAGTTESSLNSGLWGASYTADGLHASTTGTLATVSAGVFTRDRFTH